MTTKQKAFCTEYLKDFNGTQAAIRAGYSENTAQEISSQNLSKLIIKETIQKLADEITGNDNKIIIENIRFWIETRDDPDCNRSDRLKASDLLGKYKAMFTDKIEHLGGILINIEGKNVNL